MRVLLIEDEPTTARAIELMLTTEGFNVYSTDLGEEGLDLGKLYDYDIILLDLNLPDMHGYDVLKKLRVAKVQTPVLILSGISEMDSKVRSFGFGADDYVTKPFHREELVARIHAVVRRSKGHSQSVIRTGKLAVNLDAKTVEVDGESVTFSPPCRPAALNAEADEPESDTPQRYLPGVTSPGGPGREGSGSGARGARQAPARTDGRGRPVFDPRPP